MKKRMLAAVMAALTAASLLAGCGQTNEKPAEQQSETKVEESKQETMAVVSEDGRKMSESGVYKTGLPIVDEEQTLKVMVIQNNPDVAPEDTVIHKEIQQATGVKIEWECIPATSWPEKKGLLFATGELPDIILGGNFTDAELLNMADADQILPLNDLIAEYGENVPRTRVC